MSARRTAIELGLVVGGLALAVVLLFWGAGWLAAHATGVVPHDVDDAIGRQAWQMSALGAECADPGPRRYVERIAAPLVEALGPTPFEFRFRVVDSEQVNAYALPGGYVTVNMGLLEQASSGEEIAAVLAHELTHVTERHGTKRVLRQMGGWTVLSWVFGGSDVATPAAVLANLASTAYDRDEEREADRRGRALMKRAGLDPRAMARFFERLARSSVTPPELLSTHPDPGDRAAEAQQDAEGYRPTRTLPPPTGLRCR